MKQKFLFSTVILCLIFAGPVWACDGGGDNTANANAEANAGAQATANSGSSSSSSSSATGGTGIGVGGAASVEDVKTGDIGFEATIEAPDVSIEQTFEASDLWKQKGGAVLQGAYTPPGQNKFGGWTEPLLSKQETAYQIMATAYPQTYRASSMKKFEVRNWKWGFLKKKDRIPFQKRYDHSIISFSPHSYYLNYMGAKRAKVKVIEVEIKTRYLEGSFVPVGIITATSRNAGDPTPAINEDVAEYAIQYIKGFKKLLLFDVVGGRGFILGSEEKAVGGGIAASIIGFANFSTSAGGGTLGGHSGWMMQASKYGKVFLVLAQAEEIGLTNARVEAFSNLPKPSGKIEGNGNGKKAVGSGVVK